MELKRLINIIATKNLIPVIGTDLSVVSVSLKKVDESGSFRDVLPVLQQVDDKGNVTLTLNQYLALRLADKAVISLDPHEVNLGTAFLKSELSESENYSIISEEYHRLSAEEIRLDSFAQLAKIAGFNFYINTGLDDFLVKAFASVGIRVPCIINSEFLQGNNNNFEVPLPSDRRPVVFNMFGAITNKPINECCITDENYVETIIRLYEQSAIQNSSFSRLFEYLKDKSLLIIGSSFPDWLMRFLVRLISMKRFAKAENGKYVSDIVTWNKIESANFLQKYKGSIITDNDQPFATANEFVSELMRRIPPSSTQPFQKKYKEKIFISFSSDDRDKVRLLAAEFEKQGVDVFFDENKLQTGSALNDIIKKAISQCDIFLPVISSRSIKDAFDPHKYVYFEWMSASITREIRDASGRFFIQPLKIDEEPIDQPSYEKFFKDIFYETIPIADANSCENLVMTFIGKNKLSRVTDT